MIRTLSVFLLLVSLNAQGQSTVKKDPQWAPIIGYVSESSKAYVDKNSLKIEDADRNYRSGTMLIVMNKPQSHVIGGKTVQLKSMIRYAVASCNDEVVSYMFDMYYNIDFPKGDTTSVYTIQYEPSERNIIPLKKSTLMYKTLCPEYI